MERDSVVEASMPVQSRINVVYLAKLANYWEIEGYNIRTMSQLVSWSVNLLHEVLVANGKVDREDIGVIEARNYLVGKGLSQKSMDNRAFMKLGTAVRFESMRDRGIDPREVDPVSYNILHKKVGLSKESKLGRSIEPFVGEVTSIIDDDEHERAMERIREEKEKERKEQIEKELKDARESGLVVSDEWIEERRRKDEEIKKRENAPFDPSMIKTVEEP